MRQHLGYTVPLNVSQVREARLVEHLFQLVVDLQIIERLEIVRVLLWLREHLRFFALNFFVFFDRDVLRGRVTLAFALEISWRF